MVILFNLLVFDLFFINEFVIVIKMLFMNKLFGEDKVLNKMIIEVCKFVVDVILFVFNCCIVEGVFFCIW